MILSIAFVVISYLSFFPRHGAVARQIVVGSETITNPPLIEPVPSDCPSKNLLRRDNAPSDCPYGSCGTSCLAQGAFCCNPAGNRALEPMWICDNGACITSVRGVQGIVDCYDPDNPGGTTQSCIDNVPTATCHSTDRCYTCSSTIPYCGWDLYVAPGEPSLSWFSCISTSRGTKTIFASDVTKNLLTQPSNARSSSNSGKKSLSTGAIIGIAVGGAAALILAVVLVVCLCIKKKKDKDVGELPPHSAYAHSSYVSSPQVPPQEMPTPNYTTPSADWSSGKRVPFSEVEAPMSELPGHMSPVPGRSRPEYYSGSTQYSPPLIQEGAEGFYGAGAVAMANSPNQEVPYSPRSPLNLSPPLQESHRVSQGTSPPVSSERSSPGYPTSHRTPEQSHAEYVAPVEQMPSQQMYAQPQNSGSQRFYQQQQQQQRMAQDQQQAQQAYYPPPDSRGSNQYGHYGGMN